MTTNDPKAGGPKAPAQQPLPRRTKVLLAAASGLALAAVIAGMAWQAIEHQKEVALLPPAEQGRRLLSDLGCTSCHQPGSSFRAPELTRLLGRTRTLQSGATITIDEDYLRHAILTPQRDIVQGYSGTMPSYAERLSPEQLHLMIEAIK